MLLSPTGCLDDIQQYYIRAILWEEPTNTFTVRFPARRIRTSQYDYPDAPKPSRSNSQRPIHGALSSKYTVV